MALSKNEQRRLDAALKKYRDATDTIREMQSNPAYRQAQADLTDADKAIREILGAEDAQFERHGLAVNWVHPRPTRTFDKAAFAKKHPKLADEFTIEKPSTPRLIVKVVED